MTRIGPVLVAILLLAIGYGISDSAYRGFRAWPDTGPAYSLCIALWTVAGPVMLVAGLVVLASAGRLLFPLRIGGAAALLAGTSLIVGILTYVIPCSGPD